MPSSPRRGRLGAIGRTLPPGSTEAGRSTLAGSACSFLSSLALAWLLAGTSLAAADPAPEVVRDINQVEAGSDLVFGVSKRPAFVTIGDLTFFRAQDGIYGSELWRTDGTEAGTLLVKDIAPGPAGSSPSKLRNAEGLLFFTANDGVSGRELWKSDGTEAGTVRVAEIVPGNESSPLSFLDLVAVGGTVYFQADDGVNGVALWRSDGTEAGTVLVKDINPYPPSAGETGYPYGFSTANGLVFFSACGEFPYGGEYPPQNCELWKSDGTGSGTVMVKDINPGVLGLSTPILYLGEANGYLFFSAIQDDTGRELWRTDGSEAGTILLGDINPGTGGSDPGDPAAVGEVLFFSASDGALGRELWRSDGTEAGTWRVKDVQTGSAGSAPRDLIDVGGTLFFSADDGIVGRELWKSDGTEAGTGMVKQIGITGSLLSLFGSANGLLLFRACDAVHGCELWRSDGTESGTTLVRDIDPTDASPWGGNPNSSWPTLSRATTPDGSVLLVAGDHRGRELWKSDGSEAGTVLVKDISSVTNDAALGELTPSGRELLFRADDGVGGLELWRTDGTEVGTELVMDFVPSGNGFPFALADLKGTIYFGARHPDFGRELWRSDGTEAGTRLVKDIRPGLFWSSPRLITVVGSTLFFEACVPNCELWKSDGTESGTARVLDIRPGPESPELAELTPYHGALFFTADDGTHGRELWTSDGTASGTRMVRDLNPGSADSDPGGLTEVGGTLFFAAYHPAIGRELARTNGLPSDTGFVVDLRPGTKGALGFDPYLTDLNGTLVFSGWGYTPMGEDFLVDVGVELWRSDGTPGGTALVKNINALNFPDPNDIGSVPLPVESSKPEHLRVVNGTLYFEATDTIHGRELWRSDGTESGTSLVKDIRPGETSADVEVLTAFGGELYFVANDGVNGKELWRSDGTETGTVLVGDLLPGPQGSNPGAGVGVLLNHASLPVAGPTLFFTASDLAMGRELWALRLPDSDDDGLSDADEEAAGTDPLVADTDGDGLLDGDEFAYHGSDPLSADGDGDGLSDAEELEQDTDPLQADTDGDGISDADELSAGLTSPTRRDSDNDDLDDGTELTVGTNPLDPDSDDDGLLDGEEVFVHGTDPLLPDTDGDGFNDSEEISAGSDPTDPGSEPFFSLDRVDQKCLHTLNVDLAKVGRAQGKRIGRCLRDAWKGRLGEPTIEACVSGAGDPRIDRARIRTLVHEGKHCTGAPLPFGPTAGVAVNIAATGYTLDLTHALFGPDLDANTGAPDSLPISKCGRGIWSAAARCQSVRLKAFNLCKKVGIRGSIGRARELEGCLDATTPVVERLCDPVVGRLRATIDRKCTGVDLTRLLPGLAGNTACELTSGDGTARCVGTAVACQTCRMLNDADRLARDCDLYDDGLSNASCSPP